MASPPKSKQLLDPLDRSGEILFGLIMALTFTCSISIATRATEVRQLLIGAISCNLAWGFIDATMYLIGVLAQRNRNKWIIEHVQFSATEEEARECISLSLPPIIGSNMTIEDLEQIRSKLVRLPDDVKNETLTLHDIKKAIAIFFFVSIATLPVAIPFVFIQDTTIALRVSNLVAIVMMFMCGWSVANYVGFNKWIMGTTMVVVGVILVAITISLGG